MSDFLIFTDSAADLSVEYTEKNNIRVIPFYITFDGNTYYKEGIELTNNEFFNKLSEGVMPKTSCPSVSDYTEAFRQGLEEGKKIICICLSSKLSGSYQSANIAAMDFNDEEQRVFVVDSLLATAVQGLLVNEAVRMKNDGLDAAAAFSELNELKKTGTIDFVLDDLIYLHKGGRIGKVSTLMGTLLNIKPIIRLKDGELFPMAKIRGRKKAADYVKKLVEEVISDYGNSYSYAILNFESIGDTDNFSTAIETTETTEMTMPPFCIGSTIGSHVGSSAAGIAYIKKYNKN